MLAVDVGRRARSRTQSRQPIAPADLVDDPPVGLRFAGQRQNSALAADRALAVGDGAVLLAPRRAPAAGHGRSARCRSRRCSRRPPRTGHRPSASRTSAASGSETAGLVAITHSALIRPSRDRAEQIDRLEPGLGRHALGAAQKRCTSATFSGAKSTCAASVEASPPTSRPPIALGWPVIENGAAPGLPMRPVARWTLTIALTWSVPRIDWLMPWLNRVTVRGVAREQLVEARARRPAAGRRSRRSTRGRSRRRAPPRSPSGVDTLASR